MIYDELSRTFCTEAMLVGRRTSPVLIAAGMPAVLLRKGAFL